MTLITFNNLTKADGSALIEQDGTIVQATVFGPVDVPQSKINYEEAVVEILYKPKISIPSTSPAFDHIRAVENLLKCIFREVILTRLHPRTSISILVQEIHNGGSLISPCVNAVCCALIDAGVPMKCPVAAVTVKPNKENSFCSIDFVFDQKYKLVSILTHGCIDEDNLRKAIDVGQEKAKENFDQIRDKVRERFT